MIRLFGTILAVVNLVVPMTGHRARPIEPQALFHTLFSDFFDQRDGTTYVQTGDIPAMWLRDSSEQTIPYVRFTLSYPVLSLRFAGVIERNARNIAIDPYANAFDANYNVWERKWEADGPAWPVILTWVYWHHTTRRRIFTRSLHSALRMVVDTWRCEQLHATCSHYKYSSSVPSSTAFNPGTGMVWTAFRPSDDPVQYHFNIPQEAIVVVALQDAAQLAIVGYHDQNLANQATSMAIQVQEGIQTYGRIWNPQYGGWAYVYETDGLGHDLYADDANIPNLTALPYIGFCSSYDPTYLNTRNYALSKQNPWYYSGTYAAGLGSPHTPPGFVWPLGIIARGLTATSSAETMQALTTLAETDSKDGLIHESFYDDGYWRFTRSEFGWGNALYAELIFRTLTAFDEMPFTASEAPVLPFERIWETPRLVGPLEQLANGALVYKALNDLLEEAAGRTVIPRVQRIVKRSAR
jgi:uncharacterized protein